MIPNFMIDSEWAWKKTVRVYALATAVRMLHYGRPNQIERFRVWVGADEATYIPPVPTQVSSACVFKDDSRALVLFEGTREFDQVMSEVIYARPSLLAGNLSAHSFFVWCMNQVLTPVRNQLDDLPTNGKLVIAGHSLGGAVAHCFWEWCRIQDFKQRAACVTFGQPRTFVSSTPINGDNYLRVINENDPIPTVPFNEWHTAFSFPPYGFLAAAVYNYVHINQAMNLFENGDLVFSDNYSVSEVSENIYHLILGGSFSATISRYHIMQNYTRNLKRICESSNPLVDISMLNILNAEMDVLDAGTSPPFDGAGIGAGGGSWSDENVVIPTDGTPPVVPPQDVGRIMEQRGVAHQLVSFPESALFSGGSEMALHAFRSRDRQLLTTLEKICQAIIARDARTDNPKPTSKLSNRLKMFDKVTVGGVLVHPLEAIQNAATSQLALPPA